MAIPSGSGTEVLKRIAYNANNNATRTYAVGTNHIWTILSVIIHCAGSDGGANFHTYDGTSDIKIWTGTIKNDETFVWNDRYVLTSGDSFRFWNAATDMEWVISYIDQDWS